MTHRDGVPRLSASTRVAGRCGTSEAMRPVSTPWAARKPWEAAVPVGRANRQRANGRASESLADVPHRRRLPSYPADRLPDLYGSLSTLLGITTSVLCAGLRGSRPRPALRRGRKKNVASFQGPRKYQEGGAERWGSVAIRASAEIGLRNR